MKFNKTYILIFIFIIAGLFIIIPRMLQDMDKNEEKINLLSQKDNKFKYLIKNTQNLKDTIEIKIIYREIPAFFCGILSVASITQGINKNNDTIVIISLCDKDSSLNIGNNIFVVPSDSVGFDIDKIGNTTIYSKLIRKYKSFYGNIIKK